MEESHETELLNGLLDNEQQHIISGERRQSFDQVRKLVQQEGKEARNLVSWQIPADQPLNIDTSSHVFELRKNAHYSSSTNERPSKFSSPRGAANYRMKQNRGDADFRALHWTHLFETLRRTVDAIYDICQVDQSVIECKEAIMILENYTKDFVALIEFLNAEADWERSERPKAIAWEIRKTVGSPNKLYNNSMYKENSMAEKKSAVVMVSNDSKINLPSDEANCDSGLETPPDSTTSTSTNERSSPVLLTVENPGLIEEETLKICDDQKSPAETNDDGWKVVSYAKHRRNSKEIVVAPTPTETTKLPASSPKSSTNDDRRRCRVFPKTVQEIRQTKASLAKMEYNRQYLAEQRQKELNENLKLIKFYAHSSSKFRRFSENGGSMSLPSLNQIGINFADAAAVRRIAQAAKANYRTWKGRKGRFRSYQSAESLCSLESIKEDDNETNVEHAQKSEENSTKIEISETSNVDDSKKIENFEENSNVVVRSSTPIEENDVKISISSPPVEERIKSEEISPYSPEFVPGDEDDDEAWQHLTEEEESLAQEEESLQKEIEEERKSIDVEVGRCVGGANDDDDNNDEEDNSLLSKENNIGSIPSLNESREPPVEATPMTWQELVERWKAECPVTPFSWAEMMEIELADVRSPGQAVQMHEKLSSPSRKRNNIDDTIRKHEERQAKAEEMRQRLLEEQQKRLSKLFTRVDEVRAKKILLLERKRIFMESRLAKAAENRSSQLLMKVKKAHDEEEKVHEIAFINSLEADNKRHDVLSRQQDHEMRLQNIQEERQRKLEEKAAREQAVEERRKAAEEERQTRLRELAERTKRRQEQIELQRSEQEQQRQQLAKEKAREREERLAGRRAARQATTDVLLQRIQQKQEESIRRHEENLELIKQRASEMSTPRSATSANNFCCPQVGDVNGNAAVLELTRPPSSLPFSRMKFCSICNILISNEVNLLAHLKGSRHMNAVKENLPNKKENLEHEISKCILEASEDKVQSLSPIFNENDKIKSSNKRRQKIRQKIVSKAKEFQISSNNNVASQSGVGNSKFLKMEKEIEKCFSSCGLEKQWLPPDVHCLERALNEINRTFGASPNSKDQDTFFATKSKDLLSKLLYLVEKSNAGVDSLVLPAKCLSNICTVLKLCVRGNGRLCLNFLYSGQILSCVDALATQLKFLNGHKLAPGSPTTTKKESMDEIVCIALLSLINEFLITLATTSTTDGFSVRCLLFISYVVACRCVDNVAALIHNAAENELNVVQTNFVVESVEFVKLLMKLLHISCKKSKDNSTQFLETLKTNELCYVVSFLYSTLLNPSVVGEISSDSKTKLVCAVLDLINLLGVVDLKCLQEILGQEGTSLEFRHIASFLLSYSNRDDCSEVLHRIITGIGFFTTLNPLNQDLVHSGSQPSILQQLCVLPFAYFSDNRLTKILFPTLIACCYRNEINRRLLEEELSGKLLSGFVEDNLEMNEKKEDENDESSTTSAVDCENVFSFCYRFPVNEWESSRDYFSADFICSSSP